MRIVLEIFAWGIVIPATLLMVASSDIGRKLDFALGVDVAREATPLLALRTCVSGADALVGL
jgi:hypothetical protein